MSTSDNNFAQEFLQLCDTITKASLDAETLTGLTQSNDSSSALEREKQVEAWIDGKIMEYDMILFDPASVSDSARLSKNALRKRIAEEQMRGKVEHLFVRRVLQGKEAVKISYQADKEDDDMSVQRFVGQKALMAQVERALKLRRQLKGLRETIADKEKEHRNLQKDCEKEWKERRAALASPMETDDRKKPPILERALVDIITGSGIDWYSDSRLREYVYKQQ